MRKQNLPHVKVLPSLHPFRVKIGICKVSHEPETVAKILFIARVQDKALEAAGRDAARRKHSYPPVLSRLFPTTTSSFLHPRTKVPFGQDESVLSLETDLCFIGDKWSLLWLCIHFRNYSRFEIEHMVVCHCPCTVSRITMLPSTFL